MIDTVAWNVRRTSGWECSTQHAERTSPIPPPPRPASRFPTTTSDLSPPPRHRVRIHAWYGEPSAGLPGTIRPAVKSRGAVAFLGWCRWRGGAGLGRFWCGAEVGESVWRGLAGAGPTRCRGSRRGALSKVSRELRPLLTPGPNRHGSRAHAAPVQATSRRRRSWPRGVPARATNHARRVTFHSRCDRRSVPRHPGV